LAIATEQSHADFHRNGARVSGLLSMDGAISKEKFESLSSWLDRHQQGGDRAGKPLILDMNAKFSSFGMTGVDSEHLATRVMQVEEICRGFGVMPIMIGQADKAATYASAEQMFLAHVVHTLSPWYARLEQSVDADLLTEEDRANGYYAKFMTNGLMRGASTDRAAFYASALGSGSPGTAWLTTNEVRAFEDLDAIEGGDALPTGVPPALGAADGTD
jgi:HK97 family phage portal protein